ncbi:MAG TPA: hypothetical protein VGP94_11455, partial [Tepidisphaeraceae bacterium]|nr:hypothetical protein [Tepidisphaeraceae bacterium]
LALGLAGALNHVTGVALMILCGGAGLVDLFLAGRTAAISSAQQDRRWLWLALLIVPFAALALVGTNIVPAVLWKPVDPHPYDVLCYHLQVPREWYELGRIMPLKHNVYSFFPFAAEMNYLLAMHLRGGPWAGMYLAQLMSFIYMGLAASTVCAAMDNFRAGMIATIAMVTVPWTTMLASIAYNESALLFYESLAAAWFIRALSVRTNLIRDMTIAGAMAGLAASVKYTAAPLVLIALPLAASVALLLQRGTIAIKRILAGAACAVFAGLITFSPWLIRNTIWAGNPVFPLAMRQLGHAHFAAEQVERFERAHRAPENETSISSRLRAFFHEILMDWRFGWILIPLAVTSAALNRRRPQIIFLSVAVVTIVFFWLTLTHLMARFFVPAIPLLAMMVGFLPVGQGRSLFTAAAVAILATVSFIALHVHFEKSLDDSNAYQGLFRLRDFSELQPELADIGKTGGKLALIGDAQAFYRPLPMSRLQYRSIFDVVVPPGKNIVDAWLGHDLDELRKDHYILLNPGELNRLSQTYYGIPSVPPQWQRQADQTIILPPLKN